MSKPALRRRSYDWQALRRTVQASELPPESTIFVEALERSIRQRKHELLRMLDAKVPIHEALEPVLADAMRAFLIGSKGQGAALTSEQDQAVRAAATFLTGHKGLPMMAVWNVLAKRWNVSKGTIRRSLERTKRSTWPFG